MRYILINFVNTLRHYKASSMLNIFGMAVAFAAFFIIMTQVRWGFTYNQGIEDVDRIYVMTMASSQKEGNKTVYLCRPLAEQIIASATGVESYGLATFYTNIGSPVLELDEGGVKRRISGVIQNFTMGAVSTFGFEAEQGSFDDFAKPDALAISSRFARENDLEVGDVLTYNSGGKAINNEIVAIWKDDFPLNSGPGQAEMIVNFGDRFIDSWGEWSWTYFVKLKSADDVKALEENARNVLRMVLSDELGDNQEEIDNAMERMKVSLVPYGDMYYQPNIDNKWAVSQSGNRTTDISLLVVAILIILIALINFVNFFFALVPARVRSVNTYKVFGTSRSTLVFNFIMESVGLSLLALILATVIVVLFGRSSMVEILSAPIDAGINISIVILTIAVVLISAVAGSIFPAFYITSFQPALVLKGSFGTSGMGRSFRNLLIGVQFTISIALIVCAIFVRLQHSYMMNHDMGFDKEYLITGHLPNSVCWWGDRNNAFENKLRNNPDIVDLTWSDGQIVNVSRMGWGREYKGNTINFQCYPVAYNFLSVMGIEIVKGRNFTRADEEAESGVMIFNEEAQRQYDITLEEYGPNHRGENLAEVAGICKDFSFRPLQYSNYPLAFYIFGKDHTWRSGLQHIYVRTTAGADPGKVMSFVRNTVLEIAPETPPETIWLDLFDEELSRMYKAEDKLSKQITAFTLVAIILSLMGVFGLVLFETQHRKKEIAIRRVLGAGMGDVLRMFCWKYSLIVIVCFVIAAPVSWIIIDNYLSNFAYRTSLDWWVFAVALAVVLAVTIAVVVTRSYKAASSNPVDSIKSE